MGIYIFQNALIQSPIECGRQKSGGQVQDCAWLEVKSLEVYGTEATTQPASHEILRIGVGINRNIGVKMIRSGKLGKVNMRACSWV